MKTYHSILFLISAKIFGSDADTIPEQVHMSLASPASAETGTYSITVNWVTTDPSESELWYGLKGQSLSSYSKGSSKRYTFEYNYTSPYLHEAKMVNLTAGETYLYQCGDSTLGKSAEFEVLLPPPIGEGDAPYTFGIVGDLGQTSDSSLTIDHILEEPLPLVVLIAGDLSYADCEQDRWDSYGRLAEKATSRIPWMVSAGNHEIELEYTTGNVFVAYESRYSTPSIKEAVIVSDTPPVLRNLTSADPNLDVTIKYGDNYLKKYDCHPSKWVGTYDYGNSFYSFDVATTHVIVLNPYTSTKPDSNQYKWLSKDLASVDRKVTPWIIVVTHCPMYNSNLSHHLEFQTVVMKESMEEMFVDNRIALVVAGHVHAYERTYPVVDWQVSNVGPTYIVIGDGGNREGHATHSFAQPIWSAARDGNTFGHGRFTVLNETHGYWEWRKNVDGAPQAADIAFIENPYW
eukprot:CAMPEP_0171457712 /NCGR_PEP_ID=MMETSP0945-20130129/3682_1 /TAXON_ID=109269 /ORGANISM="Vaucheria litorea, Strain CCMP2940" /LENGTH=459 /DNA_ID=CAMNT_0011983377 /DNA_START=56 /DNA_END=1432 /DNA_ORIENTATION=-